MRFLSIKYKNYRCFNDIKIEFKTTPEKNIFMVVAPNGGGKTEMLFSFQWVLYGFDFSRLRAKEDTPYSLNSTLYHNLQLSRSGDRRSCSVELEFESGGRHYIMKRKETFVKKYKGYEVSSEGEEVEFATKDAKGVTSTPETDPEVVEAMLSKIIPKKILQGIIFDGERMKELSQVTDESRDAVQGVIQQITNEELFERCKQELEVILKENSRAIKSVSKKTTGSDDVASIESKIQETMLAIESKQNELEIKEYSIREYEARLKEISKALADSKETKILEENRIEYKENLDNRIDDLSELYDNLRDDLDDGYLLISDDVLNDVQKLLDEYDIPAGLTVTAVKNILSRDTCICGKEWTPESRKKLLDLIEQLPPDNMNSALGEMVKHNQIAKKDLKKQLDRTFKDIRTKEKEIKELKEKITDISLRISAGAPEQIKQLEAENTAKTKEMGKLEDSVKNLKEELPLLKRALIQYRKDRDENSSSNGVLKVLYHRESFISKCLNALKAIQEYNKMVSLKDINNRLHCCPINGQNLLM